MTGQADLRPGGPDGPIYLFAGGGTGGHLYPALAVAGELVRRQPAARVVFACSNRPIDRHILDAQPYGVVPQPVRPIPRARRLGVAILAPLLGVAVVLLSRAPVSAVTTVLREWMPLPYVLLCYWMTGFYFVRPQEAFETRFLAFDLRARRDNPQVAA